MKGEFKRSGKIRRPLHDIYEMGYLDGRYSCGLYSSVVALSPLQSGGQRCHRTVRCGLNKAGADNDILPLLQGEESGRNIMGTVLVRREVGETTAALQ